MSTTVRIKEDTHARLRELAESRGARLQDVLADAVDLLYRQVLLDGMNRGYAELRGSEAAWSEEVAERADWDTTLADDLDPE
jgi:predicted transcriptional regulator